MSSSFLRRRAVASFTLTTFVLLGACADESVIAPPASPVGSDDSERSESAGDGDDTSEACVDGCEGDDAALTDAGLADAARADATLAPRRDAGTVRADAGTVRADAGTVRADAGTARADAGNVRADAGVGSVTDCRAVGAWPSAWVAFEDEVLERVNVARAQGATCGGQAFGATRPLIMDDALRVAARCHSLDLTTSTFSHTGSDGSSPFNRIARAGYDGSAVGENIAAGQTTPAAVVEGWLDSPGHCANIMAPGTRELGAGYAFSSGAPFRHYWTQTFGTR